MQWFCNVVARALGDGKRTAFRGLWSIDLPLVPVFKDTVE